VDYGPAGAPEAYPAWTRERGIPISKEEIEDIFLDLTQKFGFQRDSMRNMVRFPPSTFHVHFFLFGPNANTFRPFCSHLPENAMFTAMSRPRCPEFQSFIILTKFTVSSSIS
jgi:hypothetical protein